MKRLIALAMTAGIVLGCRTQAPPGNDPFFGRTAVPPPPTGAAFQTPPSVAYPPALNAPSGGGFAPPNGYAPPPGYTPPAGYTQPGGYAPPAGAPTTYGTPPSGFAPPATPQTYTPPGYVAPAAPTGTLAAPYNNANNTPSPYSSPSNYGAPPTGGASAPGTGTPGAGGSIYGNPPGFAPPSGAAPSAPSSPPTGSYRSAEDPRSYDPTGAPVTMVSAPAEAPSRIRIVEPARVMTVASRQNDAATVPPPGMPSFAPAQLPPGTSEGAAILAGRQRIVHAIEPASAQTAATATANPAHIASAATAASGWAPLGSTSAATASSRQLPPLRVNLVDLPPARD